jgi:TolB-like protein/DNA-binding SARP family transcriptional activator/Tfp pilus assembly protein PilF
MPTNAQVLLLGPVKVEVDGADAEIPPKARMLAARLAVSAPKVVPNDVLIDELWAGDPPVSVRKSLHKYVWALRSQMGDGAVITEGPGYRLAAGTDIARLDQLVAEARSAMAEGRPLEAAPLLEAALSLFRGRPLQGFDDFGFAADEARRLEEVRISVEEDLAEVELELGHHTAAAERLDRLIADNPLRERLVAALMTALYRGGRHADALAVYRRHARLLGEELGLEPSPRLAELEERILVHDQGLVLGNGPGDTVAPQPSALLHGATTSIAVLPFTDLSATQDQGYFADGVAVEVIRMLSLLEGVRVASRGASFAYRDNSLDIRRVGTELGVTSVLEGTLQRHDDRVRITVGLTDVLDGFQIWGETYDRDLDDIFAIQEDIARSVMQALRIRLESGAEPRSVAPGTAAYELYLRGMHHFYRGGLGYTKQAILEFEEATRVAPNYCLACAGLADAYSFLHLYYEPDPAYLLAAESYGRRAVAVDASMGETHASLGFALGAAGRYEEAKEAFNRALALPGGRFETSYLYGRTLFCAGDMAGASAMFGQAVKIRPENFHAAALFAKTLAALGERERALAMQRRVHDLVDYHLRLVPDDSRALGDGAIALVALGRVGEGLALAEKALEVEDSPMPYYAASAIALAGLTDRALDSLEQVIRAGWSHRDFLRSDPDWSGLRGAPRFEAILSRLA